MAKDDDNRPLVFNVTSHGQQGGLTAGQVNIHHRPPGRVMNDRAKAQLLTLLKKRLPVLLIVVNGPNAESEELGEQLRTFLEASGFEVRPGFEWNGYIGGPQRPSVIVSEAPGEWHINIYPNPDG